MKNARRKLETPVPAAKCLVKHQQIAAGKPAANVGKHNTKHACIVDADESMRIRLEGIPRRYHEDHISAKGINSLSRCN